MATTKDRDIRSSVRWDFTAADALLLLAENYLKDRKFDLTLQSLSKGTPLDEELLGYHGPEKEDPSAFPKGFWPALLRHTRDGRVPSIADALIHPKIPIEPGPIDALERFFESRWKQAVDGYGKDHPYLTRVSSAAQDWGLRARWGKGVLLTWIGERLLRSERMKGNRPLWSDWADFSHAFAIRIVPNIKLEISYPELPLVAPETSIEEWNQGVEQTRLDGIVYLRELQKAVKKMGFASARYPNLKRDVGWLFERVTPPMPPPRQIALKHDASQPVVEIGIRKAARVLHLELPRTRTATPRHRR